MTTISNQTMAEIEQRYPGHHIKTFDAGLIYDEAADAEVPADDVIVWATEEDSEDDDGTNAVDRFLIRR